MNNKNALALLKPSNFMSKLEKYPPHTGKVLGGGQNAFGGEDRFHGVYQSCDGGGLQGAA